MYERILLPLDGSPLSEQALPYVQILGKALQCQIDLLRVFDPVPLEIIDPEHGVYVDRLATAFRNQTQEYLNRVKSSFEDLRDSISVAAHEGEPATHIVNQAATDPDTLIIMSTHGRSGITRWVLGSVMDKVLRATANPLMVIRARPMEGFAPSILATRSERWATMIKINNVIVPLDGSPLAEQILPHVVVLSKALESKVILARVSASGGNDPEATEYLHQVGERLRQEGVSSVDEHLLHGEVASALVDMTEQIPNDLVAMTTHGRSGLERWVMGSVADRVVRYCGAPVLVVRAV